jgi:hypothetical protein
MPEVFLRGPDVEQRKGKGVNPSYISSIASAVTTVGNRDDDYVDYDYDDDDDYDDAAFAHEEQSTYGPLEDIYRTYLAAGVNSQIDSGVTLMLRDIPYRFQVERNMFRVLRQTVGLDDVDYIYLPMTIEGGTIKSNVMPRNKGYCFIHFSVESTAHAFAARVQDYVIPDSFGGKTMFASPAKFQGLSANLINLLDIQSKKWRPKHGVAHIRSSTGELVCVGLLPLRNLFKKRSVRSAGQGAPTRQMRGLQPGRAGGRPF